MSTLSEWLNTPERQRRVNLLARQIWESQDKKCAKCGNDLAFEDATKQSHSFEVICQPCYQKPSATITVIDDFVEEPE